MHTCNCYAIVGAEEKMKFVWNFFFDINIPSINIPSIKFRSRFDCLCLGMVWVWTEWSKSLWQRPVELIYIKRAFSWDCVRITALPQNIPIKQVCIKIWIFDWLKICTVRYSCSNKEEICIQFGDNWQSDSKYVRRDTEKLSVRSTQRRDCGKWPDMKKVQTIDWALLKLHNIKRLSQMFLIPPILVQIWNLKANQVAESCQSHQIDSFTTLPSWLSVHLSRTLTCSVSNPKKAPFQYPTSRAWIFFRQDLCNCVSPDI